jgi:hypothetical protein
MMSLTSHRCSSPSSLMIGPGAKGVNEYSAT